jgi:hypothetical protein
MIPATNTKLLVTEDWKKVYQSYKNADFKSYDFETIRRTMISYLKEKYPEDFNDYIESSEYIALIELIAYLGQNLSFRVDLNARENFLETADRRDSVLRLAQLINYNATRNTPANGLLKLTSITTTDDVFDANGSNLANTVIGWNDTSNLNWYQQFVSILNSAMPSSVVFGKPYDKKTISGIPTEQYKINSANTDVAIYGFTKAIGGITMPFEITSCDFSGTDSIKESTPVPRSPFSFLFRNDAKGSASPNTGFFAHFRQGALNVTDFSIDAPVPNEIVGINASDINDSDVWLWQLDANGSYATEWTKVNSLAGNNIIYNSSSIDKRNIYTVTTRESDQIDLNFADGVFGNLPKGQFRLFYRQSNGLTYSVKPEQVNGVQIDLPYYNKAGQLQTITMTFSLQYTVSNSEASESNANIKLKAPQTYYTQNRMVTAEDYNIAPLTAGADIVKIKSINRVASGISKYYELSDVSGKYSSTNIFGNDGALYKDVGIQSFDFSFSSKNEIYSALNSQLSPILESSSMKNYYYDFWPRPTLLDPEASWQQLTKSTNQTTGYLKSNIDGTPLQTGQFSGSNLRYLEPNTLIKFVPPSGQYFLPNGLLTSVPDSTTTQILWVKASTIIGDGAYGGLGALPNGTGPVILSQHVPTGAIASAIIPPFDTVLSYTLQTDVVGLCMSKRNFGLSFAQDTRTWYIINDTDLDLLNPFSLLFQKDSSNINLDSSWLFAFVWNGVGYTVQYRTTEYIFESENETAFFFDKTSRNFDFTKNTLVKDQIQVLGINNIPTGSTAMGVDYVWQIEENIVETDGYIEPKKVKIAFFDELDDNQIDNPDSFVDIVAPSSTSTQTSFLDKFVYFERSADYKTYSIVDGVNFVAYPTEDSVPAESKVTNQLYYFYDPDENIVKMYNGSEFVLQPLYFAKQGRSKLKFHYKHNSGEDRRLDPSKSNIIDVYLLTNSYDIEYRNWLISNSTVEPLAPTSSSLEENYAAVLEPIKTISDQIIYQPAKYKVLFGPKATRNLQATFKAVRNSTRSTTDNDLKSRILSAIEQFFALENWEFGQTFNFSELSTYVMNLMSPDITNFIIVPRADIEFGSLYEITCQSDEIFVNGASIDNIEIIDSITSTQIKTTTALTNTGVY